MEGRQMTKEQACAIGELAKIIAENNRREAEAVEGYTEQLKAIARAREAFSESGEAAQWLERFEETTREKIADELNHSNSLNAEYSDLTGIDPKED